MSRFSDVLILGAGAIGGAIALALAERGASVAVLDAGPPVARGFRFV